MTQNRTLIPDGAAIVALRRSRGFLTRISLINYIRKLKIGTISVDTLVRCENSPGNGHAAFPRTLEILAQALEVPVERIVYDPAGHEEPPRPEVRDCTGVWRVTGEDIPLVGHFDYPNGAKTLTAEVTVRQDGSRVTAEGVDHDRDPLRFQGELRENGSHIIGQYEVRNPRMLIYGTVNLRYEPCGRKMNGFYLGRETGQGSTFILGSMAMELVREPSQDEAGT